MVSTKPFPWIGMLAVIIVVAVCCVGCGGSAKRLAGPAGDNPGVYAEGGLFGWKASFTTKGTASADAITVNKKTGDISIQKPMISSDPVPVDQAQTEKLAAILKLQQEYTAWSIQFGDHLVKVVDSLMNPLNILASAVPIVVSGQVQYQLPNGMTFSGKSVLNTQDMAILVQQIVAGINALKTTPSPATQPTAAAKSDPVPVPTS